MVPRRCHHVVQHRPDNGLVPVAVVDGAKLAVDVVLLLLLLIIVPAASVAATNTINGATDTANFTLIMSLKNKYQTLQPAHSVSHNHRTSGNPTVAVTGNDKNNDLTSKSHDNDDEDEDGSHTAVDNNNDNMDDTMAIDYGPISSPIGGDGDGDGQLFETNKHPHTYNNTSFDTSLREILNELFNERNNVNNNNNGDDGIDNKNMISIFNHVNDSNVPSAFVTSPTVIVTTHGTRSSSTRQDTMSTWVYLTWLIVFSVMIFIAICGNLIVMWIVIAHRRMRSVTNYFLVNLSCADLLMSTLNCMFNFIYMLHNHWSFGEWYCTINNFMCTVTVSASVFTLTAITCDRYMAIVRPLQPRMSKRIALVAIAFVWFISSLIGLPSLIYSSLHKFETSNPIFAVVLQGDAPRVKFRILMKLRRSGAPERIACTLIWPDGLSIISQMDFTYQVVLMVLSYFVPITLMVWCYYGMGRVLWGSRSIGEMSQRQADSIRSKRKVVKMFIFVMIVFVVCWLPYHAYFIYTHFDRSILLTDWVQHLYLGFYWLAMSNAMVNPLIYYWMNARFRKYFKTAVCGWKGYIVRKTIRFKGQQGNETPVLGRHTHSFSRSATEDGEPMYHLTRWFSRRNRHRQTRSTIVRGSAKFNRSTIGSHHPAVAITTTLQHQNGNLQQQISNSNSSTPNRTNRSLSTKRRHFNQFTSYPCPVDFNEHIETAHV